MEEDGTRNLRKEIGDFVSNLLKPYALDDQAVNAISTYLYKVGVILFHEADLDTEYDSMQGITPVEEVAFQRAVRSLTLSSAQNFISEVLAGTAREVGNQISLLNAGNLRELAQGQIPQPAPSARAKGEQVASEATFEINLDNIERPGDDEIREAVERDLQREREIWGEEPEPTRPVQRSAPMSSDFTADMDLSRIPRQEGAKSLESLRGLGLDLPRSDSSDLTSESFKNVPEVSVDLDY